LGLKISVESVMRSPAVTALASDTVLSVAEKMILNDIGAVIIISQEAPSGIITERDIIRKILIAHKDSDKIHAQEIMSSPLVSIEADKSLTEALKLMRDKKVRRLGVTKKGAIVGILTERRLLDSLPRFIASMPSE